jgi:dual specificity MAP kinase phosphatase
MKIINWLIVKYQLILDIFSRIFRGSSLLKHVRITPNLYLGGSFRKRGLKKFKKWGITAVVNMRTTKPVKGIKTLHLATKDLHDPKFEDLEKGVNFIKKEIQKGGKVYIHCRQGVGRGPTMLIAYLLTIDYTLDEAIELIKKIRPFIKPTKRQMAVLKKFAKNNN